MLGAATFHSVTADSPHAEDVSRAIALAHSAGGTFGSAEARAFIAQTTTAAAAAAEASAATNEAVDADTAASAADRHAAQYAQSAVRAHAVMERAREAAYRDYRQLTTFRDAMIQMAQNAAPAMRLETPETEEAVPEGGQVGHQSGRRSGPTSPRSDATTGGETDGNATTGQPQRQRRS
jgi:hypothetical protein